MSEIMIEESELHNLKNLAGFLQRGLSNPKTREKLLRVQKELDPSVAIPELDAAEPVMSALQEMRNEMKALREESQKEKDAREEREKLSALSSKWEKGREKLRERGYSEEGLKAVEDLMQQEGIANHEAGVAYFERLNPPASPINVGNNKFDFFQPKDGEDTFFKDLMESGGDTQVFNQGLNKILQDVTSSRRSR